MAPPRQCMWIYSQDGLPAFKNASTSPGFDARFNPTITISRRGLTIRVVGTLPDAFMAKFGNSMARVVQRYPYLTPVKQTAIHTVNGENPNISAAARGRRGEILRTDVVTLPPNSVMLVYPASIAAPGYNTLAGNWVLDTKTRQQANNSTGAFGKFPYLSYSGRTGHAMHGPITAGPDYWRLMRGEVSHGCNRMQGEHVVELSVLLGCGADPRQKLCPNPAPGTRDDERVTVMEEFDHVPNPSLRSLLPQGENRGTWDDVLTHWVGVDVAYPRLRVSPQQATLSGKNGFLLEKTQIPRAARGGSTINKPFVWRSAFPTWDNRTAKQVRGFGC